jgi:hypothetical protein
MPLVLVETMEPGVRRGNFSEQLALDLQIFRHRFDNPIAVLDAAQVILEISGTHQRRGGRREKGHRLLLGSALDAGERRLVAVGLAGADHIQQQRRNSCVGEVGGDARAHGPRAQNCDSPHRFPIHQGSLPRNAGGRNTLA